jgi:hypothetical protein
MQVSDVREALITVLILATLSTAAFGNAAAARAADTERWRRIVRRSDTAITIPIYIGVEGLSRPDPDTVAYAQREAAAIYRSIGITLEWTDEDETSASEPSRIVVAILSDGRTQRFLRSSDLPSSVLGIAPYETSRVYLFWDRIARRAQEEDVLPSTVLGRVLAHELGHHLLPLRGHSEDGLMRPTLDYRRDAPPTFTWTEIELIHALLSAASH